MMMEIGKLMKLKLNQEIIMKMLMESLLRMRLKVGIKRIKSSNYYQVVIG
jgi:hypothetical protein